MNRVRRENLDEFDAPIHCGHECVELAILIPSGKRHKLEELNARLLGDDFVTRFVYHQNAFRAVEVAVIALIMVSILLPHLCLDTFSTDEFPHDVALGISLPATALVCSLGVGFCLFRPRASQTYEIEWNNETIKVGAYSEAQCFVASRIFILTIALICNAKIQQASQDWSVAPIGATYCSKLWEASYEYADNTCDGIARRYWFGTSLSGFASCTAAMENMGIVIDVVVTLQWAALVASCYSSFKLSYIRAKFIRCLGGSADIVVGTLAAYNGRMSTHWDPNDWGNNRKV